MPDHPGHPQGDGQKQGGRPFHQHFARQFFLKLPIQLPGAVPWERDGRLRSRPGKRAEGGEHRLPIPLIGHNDTARALVNHGLPGPGLPLQPGFQQIRLAEGHSILPKPQAHPASALMYNGRSHSKSLLTIEKGKISLPPSVSSSIFRPPGPPPGSPPPWRPEPR